MAVGKSHRIVVEIDPELKERIYNALRSRGLTLKDWFTQQAMDELLAEQEPYVSLENQEG